MAINLDGLTAPNGAIQSLRELTMLAVTKSQAVEGFVKFVKARNGDKVGGIRPLNAVGLPDDSTCTPSWQTNTAGVVEREWAIKEWVVSESICYKDLLGTLAEYDLNEHSDIADVSSTVYADVVASLIEEAIQRMMWRLLWFGNTAADNIADGGYITAGKNPELFTALDGYFKRLFALVTSDATRRVEIAANAETTYAEQMDGLTDGRAVLDALIRKAPMTLRQKRDGVIICTQSIADAYTAQLTLGNAAVSEMWTIEQNGLSTLKRGGVTVYAIPELDKIIQEFENTGTKYRYPHRAVYFSPSNFLAGSPSGDAVTTLNAWFEKKDQAFYILVKDMLGTQILDTNEFQIAY